MDTSVRKLDYYEIAKLEYLHWNNWELNRDFSVEEFDRFMKHGYFVNTKVQRDNMIGGNYEEVRYKLSKHEFITLCLITAGLSEKEIRSMTVKEKFTWFYLFS